MKTSKVIELLKAYLDLLDRINAPKRTTEPLGELIRALTPWSQQSLQRVVTRLEVGALSQPGPRKPGLDGEALVQAAILARKAGMGQSGRCDKKDSEVIAALKSGCPELVEVLVGPVSDLVRKVQNGRDWSSNELKALIAAYFGKTYAKTPGRKRLLDDLLHYAHEYEYSEALQQAYAEAGRRPPQR